jgi:steroid delta-isomerase-like uncharacterized protein
MDHAATMRRTYELISEGDIEAFGELLADGFIEHEELPGLTPTKDGVLELFRTYRSAFPDLRMDPVDIIASDDKAVARVIASGTQTGEFMGMPPTGKRIEVQVIDIMRFDGTGAVCEHWGVMDTLSMLQQLGALPDGPPPT